MEPNQGPYPPPAQYHGGGGAYPSDRGRGAPEGLPMRPETSYYAYPPTDLTLAHSYGINNHPPPPPMTYPNTYIPPPFAPSMELMNGHIMAAPNPNPLWIPPAPGNFLMTPENMFNQNALYGPVSPALPLEQGVPFDPNSEAPFIDRTVLYQPRPHGVMRIKNIPYGLTVSEVHQFICKYVHMNDLIKPHEHGFPIHIIMERSTGKTMDCYIELTSPEVAKDDWERGFSYGPCRFPKLGQRHVIVELSDQAELMRDLFPRARSIAWDKDTFGVPSPVPTVDKFSSGFAGFFTAEEMAGVVRHAETPQRSPFASRSLQRTYESTISTLYKFPWSTTSLWTMKQRDILFKTYARQLEILIFKIERYKINGTEREVGLDIKLLMDFLFAGLNCPGFSERQKAAIADASRQVGPGFRTSVHARNWPFQALAAHPSTLSDQDIGMWLQILNLGMVAMERENRKTIGIRPDLEVVRDTKGYVLFKYTDAGADLSRREYASLEKDFMLQMIHKGWASYMHQAGIDPPPGFEEALVPDTHNNEANAADDDEAGDGHQAEDDLTPYEIQRIEQRAALANERAEATSRQLACFLELLKVTHGEEYVKEWNGTADKSTLQRSNDTTFGPALELGVSPGPSKNASGGRPVGHSHTQSLSYLTESVRNGKKVSLSPPFDLEPSNQGWTQRQRHASDSALHGAFPAMDADEADMSTPRISTARKNSPTRQATNNTTATEGLGPAPVFQVPRRERQVVSIRAPDGTPVSLPGPSLNGKGREAEFKTPQGSNATTPVTGSTPTSRAGSPHRSSFVHPYRSNATNVDSNPVVMPKVGRPSPGHTHNFGMGSTVSFVAPSTGPSPAIARSGHGMRMVAESGSPLARGTAGGTATASSSNIDSTLRSGPGRGRARSTLSYTERIDEEEFEHPQAFPHYRQ